MLTKEALFKEPAIKTSGSDAAQTLLCNYREVCVLSVVVCVCNNTVPERCVCCRYIYTDVGVCACRSSH